MSAQQTDGASTAPRINELSAAERNKTPIFAALTAWLAPQCRVLEIGAGDAAHARHAARVLPKVAWQISEAPAHYPRLAAALAAAPIPGLAVPLALDVRAQWPAGVFDAVYAANVAHIMDWSAVAALFAGAARHLTAAGLLCLYGPFFAAGEAPAAGNLAFDRALRARDPAMGIRRITDLDDQARACAMTRAADIAMPANNRLLIWRRDSCTPDAV